jgi:hypothetical protein
VFGWLRPKRLGSQKAPSPYAIRASSTPAARPVDYLEDEVAAAFFEAREYESYFRSLLRVDERRAFHDQLQQALLRILRIAGEGDLSLLDEIIARAFADSQQVRASSEESPARRVRRAEPEGMRLLGSDAGLDLKHLKEAYRAAAIRFHPDAGGSHEQMVSVNRAYEQLHRIFVEEGDQSGNYAAQGLSTTLAYLWTVRRLLFEIALDEWALDDAALHLEVLSSDRERCDEVQGQRLIDLIEPSCKLTERLCAAGNVDRAATSLAVAQRGLTKAKAVGLTYDWFVRQAAETVEGIHKPRFVLNEARQVENAFRLGAIDEKRYRANSARIAGRKEEKQADRSKRVAVLAGAKFSPKLKAGANLSPSAIPPELVSHPGYFDYRADRLTSDQQAEYLSTFRDGSDLDSVAKYAFVRLSSLLRPAVLDASGDSLPALMSEVDALSEIEPRCAWSADSVREVMGFIAALNGRRREAYAQALMKLLEPRTQRSGMLVIIFDLPVDLTESFFNSARELAQAHGVPAG